MSSLKVKFLPFWSKNPYHILLTKHLEELSVQVEPIISDNSIIFLTFAVRDWKPDILHFHTLHPFFLSSSKLTLLLKFVAFFSQVLILRLIGVKIVWTVHDRISHENVHIQSERIFNICFARFASAIITHCETAKREITNLFQLKNNDKIFVVPHGNYVDYYENKINRVEARRILGIPDASLILLFFGFIRPYKGLPELINAFKQLHHDRVHLVIAGRPLTDEVGEQIRLMTVGHANIKFIPGFVADNQVQVYMNACDAVILPYRDILTSGSVILAMSFGRACIAPRKGCIGEVIDDSGAFLYDPNDEQGLLQAMKRAVQQQTELLRMGEHNRRLIEQWGWNRISEMTLKVYQQQ